MFIIFLCRDVDEVQDEPAQNKNTPVLTDKDTTEVAPAVDLDDLVRLLIFTM